jgi:hypothetical protein
MWIITLVLSSVPRLLAKPVSSPRTKSSTLLRRLNSASTCAGGIVVPPNRLVNSL